MMRGILSILLLLATAASAANQYETAALAKARALGLTASDVAAKKYAAIADAAGVTLGPKGESPAKFFWRHVRRYVVGVLAREEKDARIDVRRVIIRDKIRQLFPQADIEIDREKNRIIITGVMPDPEEDAP